MSMDSGASGGSFSDLLDANRRQLEALYTEANITPSRVDVGDDRSDGPVGQQVKAAMTESSDPAQWLDEHYPNGWQYEVRDRRIADHEAFVLVRLEVSALGVRKSQFGCAACDDAENGDDLTVESNRNAREKRAYENAIKDALLRCIDLL